MKSFARWVLGALVVLLAFLAGRWGAGPGPEVGVEQAVEYTCSMHPQIRQPGPGSCPICGMDLIPAGAGPTSDADRVVLSDRARAKAELRTTPVLRRSDAVADLRLLGRVEPAESTRRNVTTWIAGRIDRLHVNTTGERVRKGQVIATLYSPEVYAAHQDLITARQQLVRLEGAGANARGAAESALAAARSRLRLLGVPDAEIDAMATADRPTESLAIRSPFAGTVIERAATEGAYVTTGTPLYRIADLDVLWVQLDAYEIDLPRLSVGQSVELEVEALPGEVFEGQVDFIEPSVDPTRRTARLRVVVDNAEGRLRPGMFAEAVVHAPVEDGVSPLVIPATAPLFTGRRSVVYVEVPDEHGHAYEPRTVRLGPRLGDVYPVVSGLVEGERVVSRGAFALDADLQIRGGASMMTRPDDLAPDPAPPVTLSPAQRATLAPVVSAYLDVQRALAEDDPGRAAAGALALAAALDGVDLPAPAATVWRPLAVDLLAHATHVARATDLGAAREGFEPLSAGIELLLVRFGNPLEETLKVAFCPMARGDGARWVQTGDVVDNAYFGDAMRRCGELRAAVAPGATLDGSRR